MPAKKFKWQCPSCGKGRLLGARPKKQATARYCLPCSETSGLLVGLTCPKLDKASAKKSTARKEKRVQVREKRRLVYMVGELDIQKELARVWRIAKKLEPGLRTKAPTLEVRRWKKARPNQLLGFAHYRQMLIRINIFEEDSTVEGVQRVIVHEVAHLVADRRRGIFDDDHRHHGDVWRAAHAELSQDALGRTPHPERFTEGY